MKLIKMNKNIRNLKGQENKSVTKFRKTVCAGAGPTGGVTLQRYTAWANLVVYMSVMTCECDPQAVP